MADHSEVAEATPMDTHPPPDPTKGLPQLFRSRRLSSDFSEDGDNADSRRISISNGASMRTPGVATESVLFKADDIRGTDVLGKSAGVEAMLTEEARVLSPSTVQKVNVFDVAFSQKLSEAQDHKKQVQQTQPGQTVATKTSDASNWKHRPHSQLPFKSLNLLSSKSLSSNPSPPVDKSDLEHILRVAILIHLIKIVAHTY